MVHNAVSIKSTHSTIQLGIFSYTPLHDRAQRGWNCEKEEKLEGQREESIALPSARPQTSTVVDLAEHFNDSSLPRAFTVPAVARLGQQSVHARSMKQLLNNWASRCAPFCLFFTPLLISHTIVIYVSSSPLLSTRSFTVSFLLSSSFLFAFRSVKKKKRISRNPLLVLEPSIFYSFFSPLPSRSSVNNSERKPKILKFEKLGWVSSFFLFLFFLKHREPLCQSSTSDFKKLLMMERGVGEREGRTRDIVPREKKVLNLSLWKWRGSRAI